MQTSFQQRSLAPVQTLQQGYAIQGQQETTAMQTFTGAELVMTPVTSVSMPAGAGGSLPGVSLGPVMTSTSLPMGSTTYPTVATQLQGRQGVLTQDQMLVAEGVPVMSQVQGV